MVSSRWVLGLSTGRRPLSASITTRKEPRARNRSGLAISCGWASPMRTSAGRLEVCAGIDMAKMATRRAGSASPERFLALGSFLVVILAESGRLPVDNPSTHLELTMIHEAMVLEYAGPDLGLVILGESMRLALLLGLLVNLLIPWGIADRPGAAALVIGLGALVGKVVVAGIAIATFEVFTAKLRLFRLPELLAGAFVLAVVGAFTALVIR